MAVTLADLLTAPTEQEIREKILADLNGLGFPVSDWDSGGVAKTFVEMLVTSYLDFTGKLQPLIAGGGFLDDSTGDWLRLLAKQAYQIDFQPATPTILLGSLFCDGSHGPYTISPGDLIAQTDAGRRYFNSTGGTIPSGGPAIPLHWTSEGPNDSTNPATNYVDGPNTLNTLIVTKAGLTVGNSVPDVSPVSPDAAKPVAGSGAVGASTGTVIADDLIDLTHGIYKIRIITTGQVGAGSFEYDFIPSGGSDPDYTGNVTIGSTFTWPVENLVLHFANGAVNPSFVAGDVFTWYAPGSGVIQQGQDLESDNSLRARCRAQWPALSTVATESKYATWAKAARPDSVTKVAVAADTSHGGRVNVTIAGQTNPLGSGIVTDVQAYLDARADVTDFPVVVSATGLDIRYTGSVVCKPGGTAGVKAAADAAWESYIAEMPMGGTVRVSRLQEILMDAGAVDIQALALTSPNAPAPPSASPNVNITLAVNQVADIATGHLPSQDLTFYEVGGAVLI